MVDVAQLGRVLQLKDGPGRDGFVTKPVDPAIPNMTSESFYVYILYCMTTCRSYVGQTSHLLLRFYEHRDGLSRWTRRMKTPVCVHWEQYDSRSDAMRREKQLKSGQGYYERQRIIASQLPLFEHPS